ncbi:hypothetical protein ACFO3K_14125 [Cellulomonas algicola]|uniref:Uncharacterized protein n=1 Tax=Cellulomonas algicola TaxID=2071633 RepID=A0A401V560_9CELL|nr:hypothetical protein [Cellulomonas algicola]GCD22070.1 hypothetical protein CTKZ_36320 [Cellulomonas algicola]
MTAPTTGTPRTVAGRRPIALGLRVVLAVCVVASAVVHLILWNDGMKNVDVVGQAFLLNGVAGLVLGVLLLVWRSVWPLLGAIAFGAATLGAFVVATTVGLFGVHSRWEGTNEWISAITEALAIVLGIVAIVVERRLVATAQPLAST